MLSTSSGADLRVCETKSRISLAVRKSGKRGSASLYATNLLDMTGAVFILWPSMLMLPLKGMIPAIDFSKVDFPDPLTPFIQCKPLGIINSGMDRTLWVPYVFWYCKKSIKLVFITKIKGRRLRKFPWEWTCQERIIPFLTFQMGVRQTAFYNRL